MKIKHLFLVVSLWVTSATAQSSLTATGCVSTASQIDLDINNIRARILVGGDLWWNPVAQMSYYEYPKGSGKSLIYSGAIWIGGFDPQGQLKVAAQTYRQSAKNDYWGGPISKTATSPSYGDISQVRCNQFDRFWNLTRADVQTFLQNGVASAAMQQWPGNGDVANGELPYLAPFFDANNDGVYNYQNGDYPYFNFSGNYPLFPGTQQPNCSGYLFGDQCIWWIFNDVGNNKTETGSNPIGLEVHAMAYAYNSTDTTLNNTTFYTYQMINRSNDILSNTYIGIWCDPDLGNATDDYVGCDVGRNLGYVFNGDAFDDGTGGYGYNPPSCGIKVLQGPIATVNDGLDNNNNSQIDEPSELIGMSKFLYYVNINNIPTGNPAVADDYYDYLSGHWLDGVQMTYGGDGKGSGTGATATPCNFMFPNNTDITMNNLGYPQWNMVSGGFQPNDMRFLQSTGSFSFFPGQVVNYSTAVIASGTSSGGPTASLANVISCADHIQTLFDQCFANLTSVNENVTELDMHIYPVPFQTETAIELKDAFGKSTHYQIYSLDGTLIEFGDMKGGSLKIGSLLTSGTYVLHVNSGGRSYSKKIIKGNL